MQVIKEGEVGRPQRGRWQESFRPSTSYFLLFHTSQWPTIGSCQHCTRQQEPCRRSGYGPPWHGQNQIDFQYVAFFAHDRLTIGFDTISKEDCKECNGLGFKGLFKTRSTELLNLVYILRLVRSGTSQTAVVRYHIKIGPRKKKAVPRAKAKRSKIPARSSITYQKLQSMLHREGKRSSISRVCDSVSNGIQLVQL